MGEYGDCLLQLEDVALDEVIEGFQQILWSPHVSIITRQYCIMALEKLSTRLPQEIDRIRYVAYDERSVINNKFTRHVQFENYFRSIIAAFGSHLNVDLQQRAIEFGALCRSFDHLRGPILEKMPPMPVEKENKRVTSNDGIDSALDEEDLMPSVGEVSNTDSVC